MQCCKCWGHLGFRRPTAASAAGWRISRRAVLCAWCGQRIPTHYPGAPLVFWLGCKGGQCFHPFSASPPSCLPLNPNTIALCRSTARPAASRYRNSQSRRPRLPSSMPAAPGLSHQGQEGACKYCSLHILAAGSSLQPGRPARSWVRGSGCWKRRAQTLPPPCGAGQVECRMRLWRLRGLIGAVNSRLRCRRAAEGGVLATAHSNRRPAHRPPPPLQLMLFNDGVERKPCIHQKNEGAGPHLAYCRAQVPGSPAAVPPTPAVLP